MSRTITVAIPVLNGVRYLDEVLAAARGQVVDGDVEILIVDSGSTDGSLEVAQRHGARVHEIPQDEFSHGGTRNLIMELAHGDHVAFLTQDATPAHERWLAALLEGFDAAPEVAAVFGPHAARADASHVLKAEMERHFANWGEGAEIDVQRLDGSPGGLAAYRADPGRLTFLSSVNFCLSRQAWEQVPFRAVPYAEDQLLGRELIEAGFAKVFHPEAGVLHSHDYAPRRFLRRYFDEFRGLREVLDHREPAGVRHILRSVRALTRADREWLERHGVRGLRRMRALLYSRRHHRARLLGAALGSNADRLPSWLRKRLSLEGRSTFSRFHVRPSTLLAEHDNVTVTHDWSWEFVRRSYPPRPLAFEPHPGRASGAMTIAWVVPPWGRGSGGHSVIFELVRQLESRGHSCAIFVFDPLRQNTKRGAELREEIREHFVPVEAQVFAGLDDFHSADVAIATHWWTAYPVRDLPRCREKVYLVQDHEPEFMPTSTETIWAEETYAMGYRCVVYTPWLAGILGGRYGLEVHQIDCGVDADTYRYAGPEGREPGLVVVYARSETHRRGVELAFAGLATLFEHRVGQRVVLYGSHLPLTVPFPAENIGVVPPAELAELYRRASVGVVFSLTNLSLVTPEMMASGLPVVELNGENVSSLLGRSGELAMLAAPRPDAIADAVASLLDDPAEAAVMATRARAFVEERTWQRAGGQLEEGLWRFLAEPRRLQDDGPVTRALYATLDESDIAEIGRRASADETVVETSVDGEAASTVATLWNEVLGLDRDRLTLALGANYRLPGVLERTRLTPDLPPPEVHLMGRGPTAAGGSLYHADLVVQTLRAGGFELTAGMRGLDFGCSSGRVVRALAAAHPEAEWHGCDPIESSIAWASEHVPGVKFRVSDVEPPLDYPGEIFDFVFAISIWSHFAEGAAVRWLDEMHRVVRTGGMLVLTAHGYQTLAYYAANGIYTPESLDAVRTDLETSGFSYEAAFGEQGDWGLVNPEWGMAFLTPEWLAEHTGPRWRVVLSAPGRNQDNQDVFVLERLAVTARDASGAGRGAPATSEADQ